MLDMIAKSLKDFFSFKILALTFVPMLLGMVIWGFVIVHFTDSILRLAFGYFEDYLSAEGALYSALGFIIKLGIYALLGICFMLLVLLTNVLFAAFYAPLIVKILHKRHFSHITLESFGSFWQSLLYFCKVLAICGACFALSFLLYLIPVFGSILASIAAFIIGFMFFKLNVLYDVCSAMLSFKAYKAKCFGANAYLYGFIAYIPSLIPLLNLILMPLQIIFVARYVFSKMG